MCQSSSYEWEAAILLEHAARDRSAEPYPFCIERGEFPWSIDTRPLILRIAQDASLGCDSAHIAACFHQTIANIMDSVCIGIRELTGIGKVCLSGGSFQNFTLLRASLDVLRRRGFQVFTHARVPPNDGGLSLGQAVIAAHIHQRRM